MKNRVIKKDIFQEITNDIIQSLESDNGIWQKPWALTLPLRGSGQYYQGINSLILSVKAFKESYIFGKWLTFKQAKELGGVVKKGQKATKIFYCSSLAIKDQESNKPELGEDKKEVFFRKQYFVFNVSQIENLPDEFYQQEKTNINKDIKKHDQIDQLIKYHNVKLVSQDQNNAYYQAEPDIINMPNISKFNDNDSYYATLLHEVAHWTGNKKRLNRDLESYHIKREIRAKEELVAEISSMFLSSHFNIQKPKQNHISYLESWLKILKKDKKIIFKASSDAQKVFNFLVNGQGKEK